MTGISILSLPYFSTALYGGGAQGDGVTDDTSAIQATINAVPSSGGIVMLIGVAGTTFLVSNTITVPNYVRVYGLGIGTTTVLASAAFAGAAVFTITSGSYTGIFDMLVRANSSTYSSNSAFTGVTMTGDADTRLANLELDFFNSFGLISQATSSLGEQKIILENVKAHDSAQGFHLLGNSGSGGVGLHELINCNASGTQNGDCYLIEDIHDILMVNSLGECTAGTGAALHVKGAVGAVTCTNCDFGPSPGPMSGSVIQISSGPNGSPSNVTILGGIIEGGTYGVSVNSGVYITIIGTRIFNNNLAGVSIADPAQAHIIGCNFNQNGSVAGSGRYDLVNTSLHPVYVSQNRFDTPQGSGANQVNAAISDIGGTGLGYYHGNFHNGANGWTATNIYAGGTSPYQSSSMQGVPSVGNITAPTFTGSPQTNTKAFFCGVYVSGGTVSEIDVGGVNTGRTNGFFFLPPHVSITVTYTVAPTWVWYQIL